MPVCKDQPYDGTHRGPVRSRIKGRRVDGSNIIPLQDLLIAALAPCAAVLVLIDMFTKGSRRVAITRLGPGGDRGSAVGAGGGVGGDLGLFVWGVATVVGHFDRRHNEKRYTKVRTWAAATGFLFMLLGTVLPV